MVIAAAAFAYCMCRSSIQDRNKTSAKHCESMSWALFSRSARRQQNGGHSPQRVPSQGAHETTPESPSASTIVRVAESARHAEWSAETPTGEMRNKIQLAISEMQNALQDELQEDELKIHGVLGQGAFGTVYHGMSICLLALAWFIHEVSGCIHSIFVATVRQVCSCHVPECQSQLSGCMASTIWPHRKNTCLHRDQSLETTRQNCVQIHSPSFPLRGVP
jgi:hypothetical protein